MKIFTLHMIFGFLLGAVLGGLQAVCFGGMSVVVGLMLTPVLVVYFSVFLSLVFGGSVILDGVKCINVSVKNDKARAGERAFGIPASQRSMDVWWFGAAQRFYGLVFVVRCGHGLMAARGRAARLFHKQVMSM